MKGKVIDFIENNKDFTTIYVLFDRRLKMQLEDIFPDRVFEMRCIDTLRDDILDVNKRDKVLYVNGLDSYYVSYVSEG